MFFIVNKTKGTISISDLNIILGPRQAVDLDKMMSRSKSNSSKMLKAASKKGHVDIRIKDGKKSSNMPPPRNVDNSLDDFKDEMLKEMKDLLSQQSKPALQTGLDKKNLVELAQQIIKGMPKPETVIIQGQTPETRTDEKVDIDESLLVDINARAIDELAKNSKLKNVKHKEHIEENSLEQNISELEDLWG